MYKRISPEEWKLQGIERLEPLAFDVLKSQSNMAVTAGPGAGKTELLAQRACYLLQTGLCPSPKRILAISYKRDAKRNLEERVKSRCGKEVARRFDSLTFDSFAKGLLDRFRLALSQSRRPSEDYDPFKLTFPFIAELSEEILRKNPQILKALRETYSYVFLDEFQDITNGHYKLIKTAFGGTDIILTAVGDKKQRIMGWAGALSNAFGDFERDFSAKNIPLLMNYRSAPRLVQIQQCLINFIEPDGKAPTAHDDGLDGEGLCQILEFPSHEIEAHYLANLIVGIINVFNIRPRDICILAKLRVDTYGQMLISELKDHGIKVRVESELQDLLSEPLSQVLLIFLKLALNKRSPDEWQMASTILADIRNAHNKEQKQHQLERELSLFVQKIRRILNNPKISKHTLNTCLNNIMAFIGETSFRLNYPQYRQDAFYQSQMEMFDKYLWASFEACKAWEPALIDFEGIDSVPIMTIHKSKGLEFHTVVFLGLEDSAFFSIDRQREEDRCAFFVAFSRAKKQVFFTYSGTRTTRNTHPHEKQHTQKVREFYDILKQAGVDTIEIHDKSDMDEPSTLTF